VGGEVVVHVEGGAVFTGVHDCRLGAVGGRHGEERSVIGLVAGVEFVYLCV
jgi:hypothetical protein